MLVATASAQQSFQLHSTTFSNDSVLPISTILNNQVNGVNTCTASGAAGYDESPELSWTGVPKGTRSFVVVLYDVTASFTFYPLGYVQHRRKCNATPLPQSHSLMLDGNAALPLSSRPKRRDLHFSGPFGEMWLRSSRKIRFFLQIDSRLNPGEPRLYEYSECRAKHLARRHVSPRASATDL